MDLKILPIWLCRKLKDAGYPQGDSLWGYDAEGGLFCRMYRVVPQQEGDVDAPTLSELIEQCKAEKFNFELYGPSIESNEWMSRMSEGEFRENSEQRTGASPDLALVEMFMATRGKRI